MLLEKSEHSIFLPELLLSNLLADNFPEWGKETQRESAEWVIRTLRGFFATPKQRGAIVNTDNQLLHQAEMNDSKHATLWSCTVLQRSIDARATAHFRFVDVCVPVLRNLAFRGDEDKLTQFLHSLRHEFETQVSDINLGRWWLNAEAVQGVRRFERTRLSRDARTVASRVLRSHNILFGGMVYASAFSLAFIRLVWMERRTRMLIDRGLVPMFR